MIGQVLGHYRILSKIGEGGMGVVYRARDEVLGRDVAVKVVSQATAVGSATRDHLLYEARASSALSHPNICTVHEVGEIAGELFIVMELVEGRPLSDMISRGALPVESVLRYGVQISGALAHAHDRNTVHRDLKSANIVVTPEGLVKILDFGLARRLPEGVMSGATLSMAPWEQPGSMSGTLAYMAPEILRGETEDHRIDLWALGVVLYEAAAGQLPFQGRTGFELSSAILQELPPALPSWIPPGLWAIVQRCLAKEPAQRYQRASEIQAALEAVQSASITASAAPNEPRGSGATVHRGVPHVRIRNGDVLLMIGTTKGAFLLRSTKERSRWEVGGPYFAGHAVYAMAFDNRKDRHRIWASTQSPLWGTLLRSTDDFGRIWTNPMDANVKFPADTGAC